MDSKYYQRQRYSTVAPIFRHCKTAKLEEFYDVKPTAKPSIVEPVKEVKVLPLTRNVDVKVIAKKKRKENKDLATLFPSAQTLSGCKKMKINL
jgi:hypothetical protein